MNVLDGVFVVLKDLYLHYNMFLPSAKETIGINLATFLFFKVSVSYKLHFLTSWCQINDLHITPLLCRFANALGADLEHLRRACKSLKTAENENCPRGENEDVWATVLALAYFQLKLKDRADEWELVAQKSESWLAGMTDADQLQAIRDAARTCLQNCLTL